MTIYKLWAITPICAALFLSYGATAQQVPAICADVVGLDPAIVDDAVEAQCNIPAVLAGNVSIRDDGSVEIDFSQQIVATPADQLPETVVVSAGQSQNPLVGVSVSPDSGISINAGDLVSANVNGPATGTNSSGSVAAVNVTGSGQSTVSSVASIDALTSGGQDSGGDLVDIDVASNSQDTARDFVEVDVMSGGNTLGVSVGGLSIGLGR